MVTQRVQACAVDVIEQSGGDAAERGRAEAHAHRGLSVVHVPVYWGPEEIAGMGAYGRWNVGPWVEAVERLYADQTI